jgi:HK97 family phage portal protein
MEVEIISGRNRQQPLPPITNYTILGIPQFARATHFLAGNLASFPIGIYQNEILSEAPNPVLKLLTRKANQNLSSFAFLDQWYFDGETRGNGFAYIRRTSPTSTNIIGLYNLSPDDVTPFRLMPLDGSIFDAENYYWHEPSKQAIPAADMLHYRPGLSYDGWIGYSPQQLFAGTFSRAQALQVFQTKYLLKGSVVSRAVQCPVGTTKEQLAEIMQKIGEYRGVTGDKDTIVLTGGATLNTQTVNAQQSQFVELDQAVTKKISCITGLDPRYMFEASEAKYNAASVEAAGQDLVRFTFRTRLENIEDELTTKLLTEADQDDGFTFRLDTDALLRGDTAVQMTVATTGVNQGLETPNEGRIEVGLQPIDDPVNDKLRIPTNLVANTSATEAETHSAEPSTDQYAAFRPLLDDATKRVETKTAKALETAAKKPDTERIAYTNMLAEQQGSYAADALAPVAETIKAITGKVIDVAKISEQYSAEIRRRAAGQSIKELGIIVGENTNAAAS